MTRQFHVAGALVLVSIVLIVGYVLSLQQSGGTWDGRVVVPLEAGELVAMMGPSGTGKSTLLNLVSGIDRPDVGSIRVNGTEVTALSRGQLADWRAANVGYIFQTHNLIPVLTAYENIEMPLLLLPFSRTERQKRVELALEAVGLTREAG